jgi:methyl-accepting chemotaxis protein
MRFNFFMKLVILVLSLTLASTGITGFTMLNEMETSQKHNIDSQVREQVENFAETIESTLQEKVKIGQIIAGHPQVIKGNTAEIGELLNSVYTADSASYEAILMINKEAQVTATAPADAAKLVGTSFGDRQYFKDAMQSGRPVISDVVISRNTGKPIIIIAYPTKDSAGNFSGVVALCVTLDSLETLRAQVKIGETGFASVVTNVNGKAIAIAHPDKSFVAEQKDLAEVSIVKATMGGQKQLMNFRAANGTDMIGATSIVKSTNWIATAMVPEQEVYAPIISSRHKMLSIIGVALVFVILLTWYFARKLAIRLGRMVQRVQQVSKGDFRIWEMSETSTDEIGQLGTAINVMTVDLRDLIRQVSQSAEQVAASSEQLKTGAEQSAQGASQVAVSIMEVSTGAEKQMNTVNQNVVAVERISAGIERAVANVNLVETTSDKAAVVAKNGGQAIEVAVSQMSNMENKVAHSAQVVVKLGERSKEIGQIVDTMAGIAGQTNLLALNAAIEAARAGEQGRGFAVVAEEVRKLAEQSQEAAKHIAILISEIQDDTNSAVDAMSEGTREVKIGADVVNRAGHAFSEIVLVVEQVSAQITYISTAIQEIKNDSQEIVDGVQQIDVIGRETVSQTQTVLAVTEEQSASMEEIAASSNSLSEMAQDLQRVIKRFKI